MLFVQPGQTGWGGRWEGGFRMGGRLYTCDQFILMYDKNHHNIVK